VSIEPEELAMPDQHSGAATNGSVPAEFPDSLTARVQARVNDARLGIDRRANAANSQPKRPRASPAATATSPTAEEMLESQSLRRVFRDLGLSYRRYRSQTGGRVAPGLRDAAYNFRAEPSLASLVTVASFLDKLDLLS
jgi:hypothetical protein